MLDAKTGTGYSAIFTAQWYPLVTIQIAQTGNTDLVYDVEASLDGSVWSTILTGKSDAFQNIADKWFLYWRIKVTTNGTNGKVTATIGCGGA